MTYNPIKEYNKRCDPSKPPIIYALDNMGCIVYEEWNGLEDFLEKHPLPPGMFWSWSCEWSNQVRLHRSDDPEDIDRYGLENIPTSELKGLPMHDVYYD